jgi:hypothetical protein
MIESQPGSTGVIEGLPPESTADGTMRQLVTGILDDVQKLVHQQTDMLKAELHDDFRQCKRATEFGGLGIVLLTVGILGLITALANFLHEFFQLSMWVSWAITSGTLLVLGIALARVSYILLERFNPIPRKTLQALRENLQWKTKS